MERLHNREDCPMAYVVYLTGEYDMDENGNVHTAYVIYDDYNKACDHANSHMEYTGYVATVREI